ncbi:MipA/OmpV family protein [Paraglaciecola aquimarina]|uniref:MipA/OmpV family protein n=1 Tax=Paraglaciecola aquimarina TaxID=1235557 RepID=A0ABU3SV22_9ALTE|nr:MipA/OmpV family protein [Paraglaciecola aquimarina]MDU0353838.1 MipA/OmpV family protein [Paraglaciecola aquimarina]
MSRVSLFVLSILWCGSTFAQEDIKLEEDLRPVWEVGAFAAAFNNPAYPAAGQNETNVIATPYGIYRGKVLRVGDGSIVRAVAIDKSWYELDVSMAASFGSDSNDNDTRHGMPDLDFIFEVGPQLKMRIADFEFAEHGRSELFFNLQARAAFSTDFSGINHRGYVFQPQLSYVQKGWLSEKTALSIRLSPSWATEDLQDYFYQVDTDYVTAERGSYDAKGGYMGTNLGISVSFEATNDIRVFVGGGMTFHSGAANINSPIFVDKSTYGLGVGMVWRILESKELVSGR